jgi:hypothetical protein
VISCQHLHREKGFSRTVEEAAQNEAVLENFLQILRTILPVVILVIVVITDPIQFGLATLFPHSRSQVEDDVNEVKSTVHHLEQEPQAKRFSPVG